MNLFSLLQQRATANDPIRVAIIGAGKFATMFMSQIIRTPGMTLVAVCDLDVDVAVQNLKVAGFKPQQLVQESKPSSRAGLVRVSSNLDQVINADEVDVIIESTGDAIAGVCHALESIERGINIVMVNVEADVLAGPLLATRARANNVIYSLAYGDQPALIVEQVDMVRTMGLEVVCAGKGTKYLSEYHDSTPETVWNYYGLTQEQAHQGGMNSKMFNSFLDGTKSAIEMAAVANATRLTPPTDGLSFPPCAVDELSTVLRPQTDGGILHRKGMVEVISSLQRNGTPIDKDLRWGVFVVFEAGNEYVMSCFNEYGLVTDSSGKYASLYRPYHLIGLELGVSVASVALRSEPTGSPVSFVADVATVAKQDLAVGDLLDGEGGTTVWGKLLPAVKSLQLNAVPIGLATGVEIVQPVAEGELVTWRDVVVKRSTIAHQLRRQMERELGNHNRLDV